MYSKKTSHCFLMLTLLLALMTATPGYAEKPEAARRPPGGETAVNNLSFPALFVGAKLGTIPSEVAEGAALLAGVYYLWDGDPAVPPCLPDGGIACTQSTFRVYVQKDPLNDWQAESTEGLLTIPATHVDVADSLESVPWRTTSQVRVEFVPFATLMTTLTGFAMVHVSGLGIDEVWGAKASNAGVATPIQISYATLYSSTMQLSMTKLEESAGDIAKLPVANFQWDEAAKLWTIKTVDGTVTAVPQTEKVNFTAEINVKGRLIYGYNWVLKSLVMKPGVSIEGWWRLTFYDTSASKTLDFCGASATTCTATQLFDPTAESGVEGEEIVIEEVNPNYPRVPVVLDYTDANGSEVDLVYIDVYLKASTTGGGGKKPR